LVPETKVLNWSRALAWAALVNARVAVVRTAPNKVLILGFISFPFEVAGCGASG
jgi:hypothetical protein